jgi:hypothetical protein
MPEIVQGFRGNVNTNIVSRFGNVTVVANLVLRNVLEEYHIRHVIIPHCDIWSPVTVHVGQYFTDRPYITAAARGIAVRQPNEPPPKLPPLALLFAPVLQWVKIGVTGLFFKWQSSSYAA